MNYKYKYTIAVFIAILVFFIVSNQKENFDGVASDFIKDNVKIFIINLADRTHKKQYMIDQMNKYDLQYNIFSAIDGTKLNIDSLIDANIIDHSKSLKYMKRPLRRGEIGCAMSHIFIWNSIFQDKQKYHLIFEDDAILSENFKNKLEVILKDIENLDWDILFLNENCYPHFFSQCDGNDFSETTIKPSRIGYGLYGYVINKKFADKCINNLHKHAIPSLFPLYMPIDDYLDYKSQVLTLNCIRSKEIIVEVNKKFDSDTTSIK